MMTFDQKVVLKVIKLKKPTASSIAAALNVNRLQVYRCLQALIGRGSVSVAYQLPAAEQRHRGPKARVYRVGQF